ERQLISNQAEGQHSFPFLNESRLEWDYSESRARLETPDQRRYRFDPDPISGFIFSRRSDSNVRRFSLLNDRATDWGASGFVPFGFGWLDAELSGGYRLLEKSRDSSIRRFEFDDISNLSEEQRRELSVENILTPENIGPGGVRLVDGTRATDNYLASLDVEAWYTNLDLTLADRIRLSGGVRFEDWTQEVETFELFNPDAPPVLSTLGANDVFPAASLTWYITDRQQLRASYAETIIRPDFKELSPAPFTDPILNREVIGNAELVPSDVQHLDLRWEFYPGPDELLSIGAFYKLIDRPIELTVQPGVEQRLSFANAEEAENFGIEFEGRKTLGFIGRWIDREALLQRFYVAGNFSIIESEITIAEADRGILTSTSRALQGQSPLIINAQLGYDDPNLGLEATVLYNFVGERISEVGVLGAPDKFEQGIGELDFVLRWRWKDRIGFSAKFGNLLDSEFEILQGGELTQGFSTGRTVSLGVDFDLL
ncbi:MAG: TonB-dependent receptor domain-containing protein, partial [Wenzhouxiangellaceae bacterium]